MTRFGLIIAACLAAMMIGLLSVVHVTGPERRVVHPQSQPVFKAQPMPGLQIPVAGIKAASLHDDWAEPRGGGARSHHAIDIMAPIGRPVLATADGRIEKLFVSRLGGLTIYQRSLDGATIYYYAHLDRYASTLSQGDRVQKGQVIAMVGATGDADPGAPHLHFEIHRMAPGQRWWQGDEIDPFPRLVKQ